jgi:hypothetical protein
LGLTLLLTKSSILEKKTNVHSDSNSKRSHFSYADENKFYTYSNPSPEHSTLGIYYKRHLGYTLILNVNTFIAALHSNKHQSERKR